MHGLQGFVEDREEAWLELERLVDGAGRRPERLGPEGVRRLGARYRAAAADLALARRRFPGDPIVTRLETLVARARHLVYDTERSAGSLGRFVRRGYWRRVAERPALLAAAAALLLVPMVLGAYWAWRDPGAASGLVPADFETVTSRDTADFGLSLDEKTAMSSAVFTNNIRVSILAFAGGIFLGLGAAAVLLFNGILLGVVVGLTIDVGNGGALFEFVTAHGVLELSCIVVAGAAGMRMGWALVDPGHLPRGVALREEARAAVEMLLGTAAWLVVAGLVEGFVSPSGLGLGVVSVVGLCLGALFWVLVVVLGRADRPARTASRRGPSPRDDRDDASSGAGRPINAW